MQGAKKYSRKETQRKVSQHSQWTVWFGKLVPSRGRPEKVASLFKVVAEKIPFECLSAVEKDMKEEELPLSGIYLGHDSMGAVRYAGRGKIFNRLRACQKLHPLELPYFSLYVISDKKHEREIETLVIRATSHVLIFNQRKKRATLAPGNITDYEGGTYFYERQRKKGRRSDA